MNQVTEILSSMLDVSADRVVAGFSMATEPTWDSLQQINVVVTLEEEFGIRFSDDELPQLTSYEGILAVLNAHGIRPKTDVVQ